MGEMEQVLLQRKYFLNHETNTAYGRQEPEIQKLKKKKTRMKMSKN